MAKKKSPSVQPQVTQDGATSPLGARVRQLAAGAGIITVPAGISFVSPIFAITVATVEIALPTAVLLTAMYARDTISERAFRLIRMVLNRPEPPAQ